MNGIPLINEKCVGAFVASAIGDALGWPNEFRASNASKQGTPIANFIEWERRHGGRYWSHTEKILAGEYSDDTQMILAVSRSILSGKPWTNHLSLTELPFWLDYERGGGGAIKRAAELWKKKTPPWKASANDTKRYFDAGGNGAAMRVLPHVITGLRNDFERVANDVIEDATLTHGHPRAIIGALCYAYALTYLLKKNDTLSFAELVNAVIGAQGEWGKFPQGIDKDWSRVAEAYHVFDLWAKVVDEIVTQLNRIGAALNKGVLDSESETLASLGCFNKAVNGAGDVAAVASIYITSKYANNPILGIKSAANAVGTDTDTIASMVGGLLGALIGLSWIPAEWKLVQDYDCLVRMAEFLVAEDGVSMAKEYVLKAASEYNGWEKSSIGKVRKMSTATIPSGRTGKVTINKYLTSLGQTIYIKKMSREKATEQNQYSLFDQQALMQRCVLKIDSQRINDYQANTAMAELTVAQLCSVMKLVSCGVSDARQIAKETDIGEATVKIILGIICKA